MWRVRLGTDMSGITNISRAKDASIAWARPKGLGGNVRMHAGTIGKGVLAAPPAAIKRQEGRMTGPSLASSSNSYPASPVKPPRRRATNAEKWPHDFACELDAVPPDHLRDLVQAAIENICQNGS